ncbi:MAG TPA: LPS export ABC transporter permease LptG [Methylococcaceae bacterium]|nr:LPS export ABC transporter permease LptG [Methylococcaceae bacterium]
MNVLTQYIVKEILKGACIALILLLTLFNLFTLTDELKDLGKGDYNLTAIFAYVALTSPRVCYELVPFAALMGSLFVLGAMGNNRELIAMRAAGVSVLGIIQSVLVAGSVLAIFSLCVGELVAPSAETQAQTLRAMAQHKPLVMHAKYGLWLREGNQFINVRQLKENGELADISIYDTTFSDATPHLQSATHAQRAVYFKESGLWRLDDLVKSMISTSRMQATAQDEQSWKTSIAPDLMQIAVVNPDNLSLLDLSSYIDFLKSNQQKSQSFQLAFWGRVFNPLVTFVMLLVATPFVISVKRGINVGGRMMIGVVIGMGFNIIDHIAGHIGFIYDLNPLLITLLPSALVSAVSVYALKRTL